MGKINYNIKLNTINVYIMFYCVHNIFKSGLNINDRVVPAYAIVKFSSSLGQDPCSLQCPSCGKHITTKIKYEANTNTHLLACIICIVL